MKRLALLLACLLLSPAASAQRAVTYATLTEGQTIGGFRTAAVYLNDADRPMGARFVHERSGFTLDLLEIQSVPQAFVWVTTFPTSDMGEPHTQEHLLLGKGNKGPAVASQEPMSLASSTAFTQQWRTCYSFYTSAGGDVFYDEFERRMDALLHPDYTDEEIRREVRNFGVTENPPITRSGSRKRAPSTTKWSVRWISRSWRIYEARSRRSTAPDIRSRSTPADRRKPCAISSLRTFERSTPRTTISPTWAPWFRCRRYVARTALQRVDALLTRVEPQRPHEDGHDRKDLPAPKPAPAGRDSVRRVSASQRPAAWAPCMLVWPADRDLDVTERTLLELFLETFAGDPTTNLYKRFIDSKTREIPTSAPRACPAQPATDQGIPVIVGFGDVPVAKMNDRRPGGSARARDRRTGRESRAGGRLAGAQGVQRAGPQPRRRAAARLAKFVNSPPGFGFRGNGRGWITQLY